MTDAEPIHLFAYGTLQPGRLRWPFLEPFAVDHRPAEVYGALFDTGWGWPVAAFDDDGARRAAVPGTLVALDPSRLAEALTVLDEVEATATDLLRRIRVITTDGDAAWAYHCAAVPDGAVAIAVWAVEHER